MSASAAAATALIPRSSRAFLRISGGARAPFLHRILTSDVVGQAADRHATSLLLDNRGHVVAKLDLWREPEAILVGLDARIGEAVVGTLQRYVLRDDVRIDPVDGVSTQLVGAGADGALATAFDIDVLSPAIDRWEIDAGVVLRSTMPGFEIVRFQTPGVVAGDGLERVLPGAAHRAPEAFEALRVEAGEPGAGAEITGDEFPQELHLEGAVDFDKGCYLGQETVARIHYRGQVNRLLVGLQLARPATPGDAVNGDGREIGRLTSVAESGHLGSIALALVRRDQSEPGTEVQVDGVPARVAALPFTD